MVVNRFAYFLTLNKMKTNAIIFIFTSIIYNMIDFANDKFIFIEPKALDDIWFVLMYGHLSFLFYKHRKSNIYGNLAFKASIGRLIYNFGILINLTKHTPYAATFFVPCFIVLLIIIEQNKWLLYHLKRLGRGFKTHF